MIIILFITIKNNKYDNKNFYYKFIYKIFLLYKNNNHKIIIIIM